MLLHGPEDRDVFFVQKRDYSVYAVKEFVRRNRAQGSQKKRDFLSILSFFQSPIREVPLDLVGPDRHLEAAGLFTSTLGGCVFR